MKLKSKQGFSLTELMVAIAIIGILTAVAVPSYLRFANRAKQTSAQSELTGIYTAEKAFFTQYKVYHPHLTYVGYQPDGVPTRASVNSASTDGICPADNLTLWPLRFYTVGFNNSTNVPASVPGLAAAPNCGNNNFQYPETHTAQLQGATATSTIVLSSASIVDPTFINFTAEARGVIADDGREDVWTIDQNRKLLNTEVGI